MYSYITSLLLTFKLLHQILLIVSQFPKIFKTYHMIIEYDRLSITPRWMSIKLHNNWRVNQNVILSSDKRVIMKIVTSAQVIYYFTSAKHEWNNTLRVHKWLFSLSRVYPTTITLSYYLFNNCFKYNFHYLWGWQWMNSLSPLVWIMNSLSSLVMIMTLFSKFIAISRNF